MQTVSILNSQFSDWPCKGSLHSQYKILIFLASRQSNFRKQLTAKSCSLLGEIKITAHCILNCQHCNPFRPFIINSHKVSSHGVYMFQDYSMIKWNNDWDASPECFLKHVSFSFIESLELLFFVRIRMQDFVACARHVHEFRISDISRVGENKHIKVHIRPLSMMWRQIIKNSVQGQSNQEQFVLGQTRCN